MNPKQKQAAIEQLPTEMIENIVTSVDSGPEHLKVASAEYPLAGQVSIEGIGHVEVSALRKVLEGRQAEAKPSLEEVVARAQNRSDTDPTWRTDYSGGQD